MKQTGISWHIFPSKRQLLVAKIVWFCSCIRFVMGKHLGRFTLLNCGTTIHCTVTHHDLLILEHTREINCLYLNAEYQRMWFLHAMSPGPPPPPLVVLWFPVESDIFTVTINNCSCSSQFLWRLLDVRIWIGHLTAIVVSIYGRYCFGHKSCFVAALYYSVQCIDYSTIQRLFIDMVILSLYIMNVMLVLKRLLMCMRYCIYDSGYPLLLHCCYCLKMLHGGSLCCGTYHGWAYWTKSK